MTRTLVVYYSRTGTTAAVTESVADALGATAVERIRPRSERRYLHWLALSAIPESTVPIEPVATDPRRYDAIVLGTPKWTLSCPPVNAFLERAPLGENPVGLVVTYGGFDHRRYARALSARIRTAGARVPARLLVQRDRVGSAAAREGIRAFCRAFEAAADP